MELNLFSFIILSLYILTITTNCVYPSALIYGEAVIHEGIVSSVRKDTDILPGVPLSILTRQPEVDPCIPSPCGPNSQCQVINSHARCTCLPDYTGFPPRCRPECIIDSECNEVMACFNNQCRDPCPGLCGNNTQCNVINHSSYCSCLPGFSGDPDSSCQIMHEGATGYGGVDGDDGGDDDGVCGGDDCGAGGHDYSAFEGPDCASDSEKLNEMCVAID